MLSRTAALRHPHIVPVLEVGSSAGLFYFVMEYCAGRSLDTLMAAHGGRLPLELAGFSGLSAIRDAREN